MMTESRFWEIIDVSRAKARQIAPDPIVDFMDNHEKTLADELRLLAPDEIVEFDQRFWHYHGLAYRWDLWDLAYWMGGGCSDDGFIDFRSCLISLGKERYLNALKDPDSLADIIGRADTPYMQAEGFQYVAGTVYRDKTGSQMTGTNDDSLFAATRGPSAPVGEHINPEDYEAMRLKYPKVVAKLPEMGD